VATVRHFSFSWTSSSSEHDMAPGEVHYYAFSDLDETEAVSISVHPAIRFLPRSALVVENVQGVTGDPYFLHTKFTVRNAGDFDVSRYSVGIGVISP
jgi:hypothetical protein